MDANITDLQGNISDNFNFAGKKIGEIFSGSNGIVAYAFAAAGIILLFFILSAGFQLMTSGGDPKKIEAAKHIITNAFIGFIIIFVSYWLVQAVGFILGVQQIQNIF